MFVVYLQVLPKRMKTRIKFICIVIAAAVIIVLFVRFVGKWRFDAATSPYLDVDGISMSSKHELVRRMGTG